MSIPFRRRRLFLPLAGVLVTGAVVAIVAGSAIAQGPGQPGAPVGRTFSYGAKFVCGLVPVGGVPLDPRHVLPGFPGELPLKPANYATDINVHNPQTRGTVLWKKAVLTGWVSPGPDAAGGGVQTSAPEQLFDGGQYLTVQLAPDGAFGIDCNDINKVLLPPGQPAAASFITGFVVINSPVQLDVTAVYTSERQDAPVIHCLLDDGQVVVPPVDPITTIPRCPMGVNGTPGKTVGIAATQAGTGLTMDVVAITPTMVAFRGPPPDTNPN